MQPDKNDSALLQDNFNNDLQKERTSIDPEDASMQEMNYLLKEAELKAALQNNIERKKYAKYIFIMTCIWLFVCLSIVTLEACKIFEISDAVLITLITTTTANVLGFFILVLKYLFNTKLP
jgi:hypothetical protein